MFTKYKSRSIVFVFALIIASILRGQPKVPDRPNPPRLVNDYAGLLSSSEQSQLESELVAYNDSSSNQVVIITVPSLGDYGIEDWTLEIGRKWGIGNKGKNNGVVILVSLEPRKVNISPGYGLEGALPDLLCKRIISQQIAPNFKEKRFYDGFSSAVKAIRSAVKGEFVNENYGQDQGNSDVGFWIFIALLVIMVIVFIIISNRNGGGGYGTRRRGFGDSGGGFIFWGGGGGFGGGGGSSNDSGGGFGGFGGGDFGGGGASGDW